MSPMIVKSSTSTTFEPYVGGIPVPNPDYPQEVQTVTGEQTVRVSGKNLIDLETISRTSNGITGLSDTYTGATILSGTATNTAAAAMNNNYTIEIKSGQTYTLSANNPVANSNVRLNLYAGDGVYPISLDLNTINATTTFTANADYICRTQWRVISGTTLTDFKIEAMLEQGSTATDFTPYQSQSYPISLGSTELCKLGDYQDYIYKSGDDWYLHKAIGKVIFSGSENWFEQSTYAFGINYANVKTTPSAKVAGMVCNYYEPISPSHLQTSDYGVTSSSGASRIFVRNKYITTLASFKTWLSAHNLILYFVAATATDTKITDATLVGQLNALAGADTYNGKTYIKVTAVEPNLPALLKVEAYKY
jgi:hypothetical protein